IRSASDAFTLFEAVRQGILPLRRHRLSQAERDNLASGQVFVWIESSEADGLERWTDGRKWSPSRTRDVFLVYEERDEPSVDENLEKASRRSASSCAFLPDRPPKPDGLMKQTFSAWVLTSSTGQRVKWHMSAYLSRTKGAELPTVQDDPLLQSIQVPAGIF
ncbi:Gti1/Pac2 family-domain-containing protein, partial [Cantharellus anzutake]|uniref:Gti1/Pac2 family-domain-containing protein n=1 Tax=Cantharellus anzutake TaxID=1750568 RepID=UPI0019054BD1